MSPITIKPIMLCFAAQGAILAELASTKELYVTMTGQAVIAVIGGFVAWKVAQLKMHVNSQFDEFKKLIRDSAFRDGKDKGKAEQMASQAIEDKVRTEMSPLSDGVLKAIAVEVARILKQEGIEK
jgi:hypothetical protein